MWHRLFGVGRRKACAGILHIVQHWGSIGAAWAEVLHEMQQSSSH